MKKILLIFLVLIVSSHAWWNESWPYRISFNITEMQGSDWNDKAVLVRFPLNASCDDIRLMESNEIPYSAPEDCILEFLDNFSAWSSNSYYIYYGSNTTKPEYNHTLFNILDFDHDFQNLPTVDYDGYTSAKHGNWKLTSGGGREPQKEKESKGIWKGNYFGESENKVTYHSVTGFGYAGMIAQTWHFTTYEPKSLYMLDDSRVSYYFDEIYNEPGTRNEHDTLMILRWLDENNTEFYDSIILHDGVLRRTGIKDNSTIYVKYGNLNDHEKTNFLIKSLINESEVEWEDFKSLAREVVFEWRSYGIYTHTHFVLDDVHIDAHRPMPRNAYSVFFGDVEENIPEDIPENITEVENETQDPEPELIIQDLNLDQETEIEQPEVENKELELNVTNPKPGQEVNSNSFEISADVSGMNPDCVVKLDNEPYQDMFVESGKASHTFLDLSDGEHSLIIRCMDDSGDSKISMLDFSVVISQEPRENNDEYVGNYTEVDSPKITGAYFMRGDILTASILAIATVAVLSYLYFFKNKKPPFGLKWLKFGKVREQPQTFLGEGQKRMES